jgi:hypothetical protein
MDAVEPDSHEPRSPESHIGIFYAKGTVPGPVPFLTAPHWVDYTVPALCKPVETARTVHGDGFTMRDVHCRSFVGTQTTRKIKVKRSWSASVPGESDFWRDQQSVYTGWSLIGRSHKQQVARENVNRDIVLHKIKREHGAKSACQSFVRFKEGWRPARMKHGSYWNRKEDGYANAA